VFLKSARDTKLVSIQYETVTGYENDYYSYIYERRIFRVRNKWTNWQRYTSNNDGRIWVRTNVEWPTINRTYYARPICTICFRNVEPSNKLLAFYCLVVPSNTLTQTGERWLRQRHRLRVRGLLWINMIQFQKKPSSNSKSIHQKER